MIKKLLFIITFYTLLISSSCEISSDSLPISYSDVLGNYNSEYYAYLSDEINLYDDGTFIRKITFRDSTTFVDTSRWELIDKDSDSSIVGIRFVMFDYFRYGSSFTDNKPTGTDRSTHIYDKFKLTKVMNDTNEISMIIGTRETIQHHWIKTIK